MVLRSVETQARILSDGPGSQHLTGFKRVIRAMGRSVVNDEPGRQFGNEREPGVRWRMKFACGTIGYACCAAALRTDLVSIEL